MQVLSEFRNFCIVCQPRALPSAAGAPFLQQSVTGSVFSVSPATMKAARSKVSATKQNLAKHQVPSLPASTIVSPAVKSGLIEGGETKTGGPTVSRGSAAMMNSGKEYEKRSTESIEESALILSKTISRLTVDDQQSRIIRKNPSSKGSSVFSAKNSNATKRPTSRSKYTCLSDIADLILHNTCKKIIVMVGAGISTASGIPDFRTPGTGLYDNLLQYNIPYPEAIFDINYFTHNPRPFFTLAKQLYPGNYKPNLVHYFVRMLHEKGLLLRVYTQNIDGLERMAGIPSDKLVEAHGSFLTASCHLCYTPFPAKEAQDSIMNGNIPRCNVCSGVVKPDIVFFGEDLPKRFYQFSSDFANADLLIVMGTSLQIEPFASMVNSVKPQVPRLLLNRNLVGPFKKKTLKNTDVAEVGELTEIIQKFARALQLHEGIEELMQSHSDKIHMPTQSASVLGSRKSFVPSPLPVASKPNSKARAIRQLDAEKPACRILFTEKDLRTSPFELTTSHLKITTSAHESFTEETSSSDSENSV